MRKYLTIFLAAMAILATGSQAEAATWRNRECRYQTLDGRWGWTVNEAKATIRCAAARFGIDVDMALFVAYHESHFYARVGSSHCGIYQHTRSAFPSRIDGAADRWPRYSWFGGRCENARSNIFAAFDLVKDSGGWYDHWCRWAAYC